MDKLLISACLIGEKTKYDGGDNNNESLKGLLEFFDLVPFCPEVEGGLPVPRKKSEICRGKVKSENGKDVTASFRLGANKAVSICKFLGIRTAILKENSPSCGSHRIYDGSFSGRLIAGVGFTTQELLNAGIKVLNEEEGLELLESLRQQKQTHDDAVAKAKERNFAPLVKEEKKEEAPKKEKEIRQKRSVSFKKKEDAPFKERKSFSKKGDHKGPRKPGRFDSKPRSSRDSKKRFDKKPRSFKKK